MLNLCGIVAAILKMATGRNCSIRYMFLVDPKVFRFVVKGDKAIFLGVQRGWGLL
jgi:hypothetical protein